MVGFGLRTLLCISCALLPATLCLFHRDPRRGKWLWAVGSWSPHWRSSSEFSSEGLVGPVDALLVLDKGASSGALGHDSMVTEKEWARAAV